MWNTCRQCLVTGRFDLYLQTPWPSIEINGWLSKIGWLEITMSILFFFLVGFGVPSISHHYHIIIRLHHITSHHIVSLSSHIIIISLSSHLMSYIICHIISSHLISLSYLIDPFHFFPSQGTKRASIPWQVGKARPKVKCSKTETSKEVISRSKNTGVSIESWLVKNHRTFLRRDLDLFFAGFFRDLQATSDLRSHDS